MQIEMGAYAIEASPLAKAQAMAEAGFNDLIVAYPTLYSHGKLETLKRLLTKPGLKLTIRERFSGWSSSGTNGITRTISHCVELYLPVSIYIENITGGVTASGIYTIRKPDNIFHNAGQCDIFAPSSRI